MESYEVNFLERYTTVFKALSDLTRLKIMWLLLSIDSNISVSEIIDVLEENQYNVSKHLKILKNTGDYRYLTYNEFKEFIKTEEYVPSVRERFYVHEELFDTIIKNR